VTQFVTIVIKFSNSFLLFVTVFLSICNGQALFLLVEAWGWWPFCKNAVDSVILIINL